MINKNNKNKKITEKNSSILKNNLFMLKYVFKYIPVYAVTHILIQGLFGLLDVMWGVVIIKVVIDAVTITKDIYTVLLAVGIYFAYGAIIQTLAAIYYETYAPIQKNKLNKIMQEDLYKRATQIDYSCYSNPEFLDNFVLAASQTENKASDVLDDCSSLFKSFITVSGISGIMLDLNNISVIFVVICVVMTFIFRMLINKVEFKKDLELNPLTRKKNYISRVFYLPDYAKEIRTTKIAKPLIDDYFETGDKMELAIKKYAPKLQILSLCVQFLLRDFLLDCILFLYMAYKVIVTKDISYGTFMAVINGVWALRWSMTNTVTSVTKFQKNNLYIQKLRGFLDYKNKIFDTDKSKNAPDSPQTITLDNVSFKYDCNEHLTLKNVSLTVKPKEKIAIVGYNGAGKSTLIKLILRLFDVSDGSISYGDNNIKDYKVKDYQNKFGVVFQDYQIFAGSLGENVLMDTYDENDNEKVELIKNALDKSDFTEKLNSSGFGIENQLTREFSDDGYLFSGGESQKVAMARVFAKESDVLILDEPSSALDPISEYNLNQAMLKAAEDKTVIFISHRLSTTRLADKIYMMDSGEIIEHGTHDELMAQNGKYAKMFKLQSEKYNIVSE